MADIRMRGFQSIPPVIKNLVIVNVLFWIAELTFGDQFVSALSLHYYKSPDFGIWQLISYMFLHSPEMFFHILVNMFMLWMFGSTLENLWGSKRFLLFYFICGIGAGLMQMGASAIEMNILMDKFAQSKITQAEFIQQGREIYNGIASALRVQ